MRRLGDQVDAAGGFEIAVGHAAEGVRINGRGRGTTELTALRELEKLVAHLTQESDRLVETRDRVAAAAGAARALFDAHFELCRSCRGAQGAGNPAGGVDWRDDRWQDCGPCKGRGYRLHAGQPGVDPDWQDLSRIWPAGERQLETRIDGEIGRREAA